MQIPMPSAIMSVKERAVSRMYRVAVCEDEKNLREDLCAQCAAILSELQIEHTVTPYSSAEELEAAFSAGAEFSLLCLDILMDGKTGMKLAQELRERDDRTSILFITGSTEFLKDGYSVRPIQYLLKPVSREDLEQAIKTDLRLYHHLHTACGEIRFIDLDPVALGVLVSHRNVIERTVFRRSDHHSAVRCLDLFHLSGILSGC